MFRPLLVLTIPWIVCSCFQDGAITVAPHLGQQAECVPYVPLAEDAKAWLKKHLKDRPQSFNDWANWLHDRVQPKLEKDCS